jgi:hypothetical protein
MFLRKVILPAVMLFGLAFANRSLAYVCTDGCGCGEAINGWPEDSECSITGTCYWTLCAQTACSGEGETDYYHGSCKESGWHCFSC